MPRLQAGSSCAREFLMIIHDAFTLNIDKEDLVPLNYIVWGGGDCGWKELSHTKSSTVTFKECSFPDYILEIKIKIWNFKLY